jgi:hypothetical protein
MPEIIKRIVFNKGKFEGSMILIPSKGHSEKKIIDGHREE